MHQEKKGSLTVHGFYIISILVWIIIVLLTKQFGQNEPLVGYVSFAATIASLILAILAIVQSMLWNQSFYSSTDKINDAAENLTQNAINFSNTSQGILSQLDEVSKKIEIIEQVDKKQDDLLLQQTNFFSTSKQQEAQLALPGSATDTGIAAEQEIQEQTVKSFLAKSSLYGHMVLYAFKLAKDQEITFSFEQLKNKLGTFDVGYASGFLVATAASSLIKFDRNDNGEITVQNINPTLMNEIERVYRQSAQIYDQYHPKAIVPAIKEMEMVKIFFSEKTIAAIEKPAAPQK